MIWDQIKIVGIMISWSDLIWIRSDLSKLCPDVYPGGHPGDHAERLPDVHPGGLPGDHTEHFPELPSSSHSFL